MKKIIYITEKQLSSINGLLLENEGTNMKKARKYLESKGYTDPEKRQQILDAIRTDVPNSRLQQCKFLLGVTRLYLDGELNNGNAIFELNKTLKYIASDTHVNEYDYNLNGETLQTLVNRFKSVANDDLKQSIAKSNSKQLVVNNNYTIVPIDNSDEASKYGKYTSWCVTHSSDMYDSYTNNGIGRFYFCLREGFENEPAVEGDNCPLDNYGLSMIAVSVNFDGSVNTVTCRWNHDNGGSDNIMNIDELEDLLGRNFYQTFKPYSREELHAQGVILFDEVQDLLDSGKEPEEIFETISDFSDGFAIVQLNGKWNFINTEGKIISNQWFDIVGNFRGGFARVQLNGKYNFINTEGKIISNQWFYYAYYFSEGFAEVQLNGKRNFINTEGKIISNQWFDGVGHFSDGFARVQLNDKWNFINTEGKIISNQWFDYAYYFSEGFADVILNNKRYEINTNGEIINESKTKKTIIITEKQKKRLKKPITAQYQVGGKVNAGIMDAVVGGMCENVIDEEQIIKNDKGEIVPEKCDKCGGKVVLQIHGEPVYVCKDCGKYFGTMPCNLKEAIDIKKALKKLKKRRDPSGIEKTKFSHIEENIQNEIKPSEVTLSSFNIKKGLNPKFWDNGHLDSRIRLKLLDIAEDFIDFLDVDWVKPKDIIMTGSLANFNWNEKYSDIDLHILMDFSDVDENVELVKNYFLSKKSLWNDEHESITIFGFPVELYVQDVNEEHDSSGVYSLDKDRWIIEPERDGLAKSKVNKEYIRNKVSDYTNQIDKLCYLYKKNKNNKYKLSKISEKAEKLWNEIKSYRKEGFEKYDGKEINNYNSAFKFLRRYGYLDKLYDLKTKTYDILSSL